MSPMAVFEVQVIIPITVQADSEEEAIELVDRYVNQPINFPYMDSEDDLCLGSGYMTYRSAKQCPLILINDRIATIKQYADEESITPAIIHQLNIKKEIESL